MNYKFKKNKVWLADSTYPFCANARLTERNAVPFSPPHFCVFPFVSPSIGSIPSYSECTTATTLKQQALKLWSTMHETRQRKINVKKTPSRPSPCFLFFVWVCFLLLFFGKTSARTTLQILVCLLYLSCSVRFLTVPQNLFSCDRSGNKHKIY